MLFFAQLLHLYFFARLRVVPREIAPRTGIECLHEVTHKSGLNASIKIAHTVTSSKENTKHENMYFFLKQLSQNTMLSQYIGTSPRIFFFLLTVLVCGIMAVLFVTYRSPDPSESTGGDPSSYDFSTRTTAFYPQIELQSYDET